MRSSWFGLVWVRVETKTLLKTLAETAGSRFACLCVRVCIIPVKVLNQKKREYSISVQMKSVTLLTAEQQSEVETTQTRIRSLFESTVPMVMSSVVMLDLVGSPTEVSMVQLPQSQGGPLPEMDS